MTTWPCDPSFGIQGCLIELWLQRKQLQLQLLSNETVFLASIQFCQLEKHFVNSFSWLKWVKYLQYPCFSLFFHVFFFFAFLHPSLTVSAISCINSTAHNIFFNLQHITRLLLQPLLHGVVVQGLADLSQGIDSLDLIPLPEPCRRCPASMLSALELLRPNSCSDPPPHRSRRPVLLKPRHHCPASASPTPANFTSGMQWRIQDKD